MAQEMRRVSSRWQRGLWFLCRAAVASCGLVAGVLAQQPAAQTEPARAVAMRLDKQFKGDLDGMVERRVVRVAAPFSRTLYFNDKGRERGISADFVRDFEGWLNRKYHKQLGKRPITVYISPTTRDEQARQGQNATQLDQRPSWHHGQILTGVAVVGQQDLRATCLSYWRSPHCLHGITIGLQFSPGGRIESPVSSAVRLR